MRVIILYRPNSEHSRMVDEFSKNYRPGHQTDNLELINIDTREGSALAELYDIMEYPAILVLQNNGVIQKIWQGVQLPLVDEVAGYARV